MSSCISHVTTVLSTVEKFRFDRAVDLLRRSVQRADDKQLDRVTTTATAVAMDAIHHHGNVTKT